MSSSDDIPPDSLSMGDVASHKRKDVTLPLPNRAIRRKYKKLKGKKHFQDRLAQQGHTVEEADQMAVDPKTQEELLKHLDVQRFLDILNGLLTGTKKLVIETKHYRATNTDRHTFHVEDVDANSK